MLFPFLQVECLHDTDSHTLTSLFISSYDQTSQWFIYFIHICRNNNANKHSQFRLMHWFGLKYTCVLVLNLRIQTAQWVGMKFKGNKVEWSQCQFGIIHIHTAADTLTLLTHRIIPVEFIKFGIIQDFKDPIHWCLRRWSARVHCHFLTNWSSYSILFISNKMEIATES